MARAPAHTVVPWMLFAVAASAFVGLGLWTLHLHGRVAELETQALTLQTRTAHPPRATASGPGQPEEVGQAIVAALESWRSSGAEGAAQAEGAAVVLEEAVASALEAHTERQERETRDRQRTLQAESIRVVVEDLGSAHEVEPRVVEQVVDLLVGGLDEGQALQRDMQEAG